MLCNVHCTAFPGCGAYETWPAQDSPGSDAVLIAVLAAHNPWAVHSPASLRTTGATATFARTLPSTVLIREQPTASDLQAACARCAGKVAQLAQGEIDRLAKGYGGRSVPAHVTLMGGIVDDEKGIFDRAALLSSQLKVCCQWLDLVNTRVATVRTHFSCELHVERQPSTERPA